MNDTVERLVAAIIWAVIAFVAGLAVEYFIFPNANLGGILGGVLAVLTLIVQLGPWVVTWPWLKIAVGVLIFCGYWWFTLWVRAVYGKTWAIIAWVVLALAALIYIGNKILVWYINRPKPPRSHDN